MNAKVIKTKKTLLNTLVSMMDETAIEEITVSALCERAGINRTTFYKYYCVPSDVVLEAADEILSQTLQMGDENGYDYFLMICRAFYENRKLMILYTKALGNLFQLFHTVLMRHMGQLSFLNCNENFFLAGGVSSVLSAWMIRGFVETPEEMARILTDFAQRIYRQNEN